MLPSPTATSVSPVSNFVMRGTLWKWTNYLSGWQPRWFVLDGGCLSYYLSPTEVHLGSRGALKVASCDITVHPNDGQRMDMTMPGGRHIYLKAASMSERQQWLLALGVAKQGGFSTDVTDEGKMTGGVVLHKKMSELQTSCELLVSQVAAIMTLTQNLTHSEAEVLGLLSSQVSDSCYKFLEILHECIDLAQPLPPLQPLRLDQLYAPKKGGGLSPVANSPSGFSEMELYLPNTYRKTTPTTETIPHSTIKPLPPHMESGRTNINRARTDSNSSTGPSNIVKTDSNSIEVHSGGCSDLFHFEGSQTDSTPESHSETIQIVSVLFEDRSTATQKNSNSNMVGSNSTDEVGSETSHVGSSMLRDNSGTNKYNNTSSHSTSDLYLTPTSSPPPSSPMLPRPLPSLIRERILVEDAESGRRYHTFFSSLPAKFEEMELLEGDLIPTQPFLHRCQVLLPFFDVLHRTAFAPVKIDINGNIVKLLHHYEEDPELYDTLQAMVKAELGSNSHTTSKSATEALLWLKRAMEFVQHFIGEVAKGEQSLDVAAGKAYSLSLRRHHNWIVRGIFNLAMKAVPYHKELLRLLGSLGTDEGERQVLLDMAVFSASLGELVHILNNFYHKHQLDILPGLASTS